MVEDIEKLISQALRLAVSQYTRSRERAKWTRLAGQLIWYKDQILRAMTWEALDQDMAVLKRKVDEAQRQTQTPVARAWTPALIRKRDEEKPDSTDSEKPSEEESA